MAPAHALCRVCSRLTLIIREASPLGLPCTLTLSRSQARIRSRDRAGVARAVGTVAAGRVFRPGTLPKLARCARSRRHVAVWLTILEFMAVSSTTVHRNFIDGAWVASASGKTFENRNPADTDDLIGVFQ